MGIVKVNKAFVAQYNSGSDECRVKHIEEPCNAIPTNNRFAVVQANFLLNYNHSSECNEVNQPCPTLLTKDKLAVITPAFMTKYHGSGDNTYSVDDPASVLTTKDRQAVIMPQHFIDLQYSNGKRDQSINEPASAFTTVPKHKLIKAEKVFVMNPQWGSSFTDVNKPMFTLIARMDKAPPYLITTQTGETAIQIYDHDCEEVVMIKQFMAAHGIIDIKMRMFRIREMLEITGLPANYELKGTQEDQKRFIGNAVPPIVPQRWMEALYPALLEWKELKLAA